MINTLTLKLVPGKKPPSAEFLAKQEKRRISALKKPGVPELLKTYQATEARYSLPVMYLGKIERIGFGELVTLDVNQLGYESKQHIKKAIANGYIAEKTVAAAVDGSSTQEGAEK